LIPSEFLGYAARCIDCGLSVDHHLASDKLKTVEYLALTLPVENDRGRVEPQHVVLRFLLARAIAKADGN